MNQTKKRLIHEAQELYAPIFPCGNNGSFWDSFTEENGTVHFWFNTTDNSTHILSAEA